jgi:hypothetical protein
MISQKMAQQARDALARYDEWAKNLQCRADEGLARLAAMRQRNNMITKSQHDQSNDELRQRSGAVNNTNPLVAFLYDLMRDHVQPGVVEELVRDVTQHDHDAQYCNGWLARYAEDLAKRLLDETKAVP